MNINDDLIGKTITGVIATTSKNGISREIWMLQFSDGTHVEFVSPGAQRALRRSAKRRPAAVESAAARNRQLALNVA